MKGINTKAVGIFHVSVSCSLPELTDTWGHSPFGKNQVIFFFLLGHSTELEDIIILSDMYFE